LQLAEKSELIFLNNRHHQTNILKSGNPDIIITQPSHYSKTPLKSPIKNPADS
jgi:hypothetical protein